MPLIFLEGKMKIKLHTDICCPEGSFQKNSEIEISDKVANGLIGAGCAAPIEIAEVKIEKVIEKEEEIVEVKKEEIIETKKEIQKSKRR